MTDAAGSAAPDMAAPDVMTTLMSNVGDDSTNAAAPGDSGLPATSGNSDASDIQDGSSGTTAASVGREDVTAPAVVLDQPHNAARQVRSCADGASLPFDFQHLKLLPKHTRTHTAVYVRFSSSILLVKQKKNPLSEQDVLRLHDEYGSCHVSSPGISCLSDLASCFHSLK